MYRNNVNLLGRITKDLEIKSIGEDNCVLNFNLAINRVTKKDAEHPEADFIPIVAWGKTAENIAKFFGKGDRIGVSGRLQSRTYEDKDSGKNRSVIEMVVDEFEFIEKKTDNAAAKPNTSAKAQNAPSVKQSDDDLPY